MGAVAEAHGWYAYRWRLQEKSHYWPAIAIAVELGIITDRSQALQAHSA